MKIMRKPIYLGLRFQMLDIKLRANRNMSLAERSKLVRVQVGKGLVGEMVCGVRVAGKECVVPVKDCANLPDEYTINWTGRLTACDDSGVVAIE